MLYNFDEAVWTPDWNRKKIRKNEKIIIKTLPVNPMQEFTAAKRGTGTIQSFE